VGVFARWKSATPDERNEIGRNGVEGEELMKCGVKDESGI